MDYLPDVTLQHLVRMERSDSPASSWQATLASAQGYQDEPLIGSADRARKMLFNFVRRRAALSPGRDGRK
jgi:hypothetical protein